MKEEHLFSLEKTNCVLFLNVNVHLRNTKQDTALFPARDGQKIFVWSEK